MKLGAAVCAGALVLTAGAVLADPCVGVGLDVPLSNASNVKVMYADVPSARFPRMWQQGEVAGFRYRIYANFTADLVSLDATSSWKIDVSCDVEALRCQTVASANVPSDAAAWGARLGQCILGQAEEAQPVPAAEAASKAAPKPAVVVADVGAVTPVAGAATSVDATKPAAESGAAKPAAPADAVKPVANSDAAKPAAQVLPKAASNEAKAQKGPKTQASSKAVPKPAVVVVADDGAAKPVAGAVTSVDATKPAPKWGTIKPAAPSDAVVPVAQILPIAAGNQTDDAKGPPEGYSGVAKSQRGQANPAKGPAIVPTISITVDSKFEKPAITLQRLLRAAGQNVHVDGILGPESTAALVAVLGQKGADLSVLQAIDAVTSKLVPSQNLRK